MESTNRIDPEKVTRPIQLLAAWLVGLIVVDAAFLVGSTRMEPQSWERGALVVAAIANVPLFLCALFLLQTRFRPELQEDSYYSQYLDKRTNKVVVVSKDEFVEKELSAIRSEVLRLTTQLTSETARPKEAPWRWLVGLNKRLPDFEQVRDVLKRASIPLGGVFGADHAPDKRTVALAERMDMESKIIVLRLAIDMKFDGYTYLQPQDEDVDEDVLFGSYGDVSYRIGPSLLQLLNSRPEPGDLQLYEETHKA